MRAPLFGLLALVAACGPEATIDTFAVEGIVRGQTTQSKLLS